MGSSNRDYMQDDYETQGPSWGHDVPTTKWLLIVTVVVYFLQTLLTHEIHDVSRSSFATLDSAVSTVSLPSLSNVALQSSRGQASYIEEWCLLDAGKVLKGQVWRLVTYVFCHDRRNPFGLVFNMVMLWFLGSALERMYGSREILWFYLGSAVACGMILNILGLYWVNSTGSH